MAYKRKTHDEYEVYSLYDGEWCLETTELTYKEAVERKDELLREGLFDKDFRGARITRKRVHN